MQDRNNVSDSISNITTKIIYQSNKVSRYNWLLIVTKGFACISLFIAYGAVKKANILHFIWLVSSICAVLFGIAQRPLSQKKSIKVRIWIKLFKLSLLQICVLNLLFHGLSQVGPYRTALLTEHSEIVIVTVLSAVIKGKGGPGKLRGSLWFFVALISLVLFDNDSSFPEEHPEGQTHHRLKHLIFYALSWLGLSDHEGGILILLLATLLMTYIKNQSRYIAAEVGGSKRLNALVWMVTSIVLTPVAAFMWIMEMSNIMETFFVIVHAFAVAFIYFVVNYYVEYTCNQKLSTSKVARVSYVAAGLTALILSFIWPSSSDTLHQMSGGAVFSFIMFVAATFQVTSAKDFLKSDFERDGHLPIYNEIENEKSHPIIAFIYSTLQSIVADQNSRTIFYFLCFNLAFTFVELTYGVWTNSLGLISDGFHMLFDCSALVMGLSASVMAHWIPNRRFPFGYGRIEVLSGFINGLFLCLIGVMIFIEAIERLVEPPEIDTERLLTVAIIGLFVNICGIIAFSMGGHGHSHGGGSHGHSHNANMEGVYLHILADTLGSVAVIVSSVLIDWYGWFIADPICSLILSVLIVCSVAPLLKASASVLILSVPSRLKDGAKDAINKILKLDSVVGCQDPHMWQHCDNLTVATILIHTTGNIPEQRIMEQVKRILKDLGFDQTTIQVEVLKDPSKALQIPPSSWQLGSIFKTLPDNSLQSYHYIRQI